MQHAARAASAGGRIGQWPVRLLSGALPALIILLTLILAGCGGTPPPPPTTPRPAAMTRPFDRPPAPAEPTAAASLCPQLAQIVAAEASAFESMRGSPIAPASWEGLIVPARFEACRIDGDIHPVAAYACLAERRSRANGWRLQQQFLDLVAEVDACLAGPEWHPHRYMRGELHEFAGGERQVVWRDGWRLPTPSIWLKLEEDYNSGDYLLRLSVLTMR